MLGLCESCKCSRGRLSASALGPTSCPGGTSGWWATSPGSDGSDATSWRETQTHRASRGGEQARQAGPCVHRLHTMRPRFPERLGRCWWQRPFKGPARHCPALGRTECSLPVAAKRLAAPMKGRPGIHTPTERLFVLRAAGSAAGRAPTEAVRGNAEPREGARTRRLQPPRQQRQQAGPGHTLMPHP